MSYVIRKIIQHVWAGISEGEKERKKILPSVCGARYEKQLTYKKDGNAFNTLSLYYPEDYDGVGKLPTVIDVHGGGWMNGTAETNDLYSKYVASQGFAVMTMSYRLLPKVNLKQQVQDIFDSIHWLEKFGPTRGFDLSRILITGDSAGGHLASMVAAINTDPELQKVYDVKPSIHKFTALGINHGVCFTEDFNAAKGYVGQLVTKNMKQMMVKGAPEIRNLTSFSEYSRNAKLPPVILIGSACDFYYPQTEKMRSYFESHNIVYTPIINEDKDATHLVHVFNITFPVMPESIEVNRKMLDRFLEISSEGEN